jgi:hypoxanthine phosphoribosyltransferase
MSVSHPASADLQEILWSEADLQARVRALGAEIARDFPNRAPGREILVVGVLTGSVLFCADLVRAIDVHAQLDFIAVSSYGDRTSSSGVVRLIKDLDRDISGRDVILVEDIVDTGLTLNYLLETLHARQPASLSVCALLDKSAARRCEVPLRYVGFNCPDAFVVGYGLDYAGRYRNLPCIGILNRSIYSDQA